MQDTALISLFMPHELAADIICAFFSRYLSQRLRPADCDRGRRRVCGGNVYEEIACFKQGIVWSCPSFCCASRSPSAPGGWRRPGGYCLLSNFGRWFGVDPAAALRKQSVIGRGDSAPIIVLFGDLPCAFHNFPAARFTPRLLGQKLAKILDGLDRPEPSFERDASSAERVRDNQCPRCHVLKYLQIGAAAAE